LTEFSIQKYYKLLSLLTLVVGLTFVLIPGVLPTSERIWTAVVLNIGFHMTFQFLSRMPIGMYEFIKTENPKINKLALTMLKTFSAATMVMPGLAAISIVYKTISDADYYYLLILPILFGFVLGSMDSRLKLKAV